MTDLDKIVSNSSSYGYSIICAENINRVGFRMYIDYHTLNSNIIINAWPQQRIGELLGYLRGAWVFSKFDLRDGYYKIPIEPKDH